MGRALPEDGYPVAVVPPRHHAVRAIRVLEVVCPSEGAVVRYLVGVLGVAVVADFGSVLAYPLARTVPDGRRPRAELLAGVDDERRATRRGRPSRRQRRHQRGEQEHEHRDGGEDLVGLYVAESAGQLVQVGGLDNVPEHPTVHHDDRQHQVVVEPRLGQRHQPQEGTPDDKQDVLCPVLRVRRAKRHPHESDQGDDVREAVLREQEPVQCPDVEAARDAWRGLCFGDGERRIALAEPERTQGVALNRVEQVR